MIYIIHIIRLVISCLCGIAIGVERTNRAKEAGIRTHCVVSCASCLMMLISIYGFTSLTGKVGYSDIDPSRIAAQIVSGIGFLGAGMIFVKRQTISGLTTAAGIWATAGIGMAIGAGMYITGIIATVLILLAQILLHMNPKFLNMPKMRVLTIHGVQEKDFLTSTENKLKEFDIKCSDVDISKKGDFLTYTLYIEIPPDSNEENIINLFLKYDCSIKND